MALIALPQQKATKRILTPLEWKGRSSQVLSINLAIPPLYIKSTSDCKCSMWKITLESWPLTCLSELLVCRSTHIRGTWISAKPIKSWNPSPRDWPGSSSITALVAVRWIEKQTNMNIQITTLCWANARNARFSKFAAATHLPLSTYSLQLTKGD